MRMLSVVVGVAGVLLVAGCGSDEPNGSAPSSAKAAAAATPATMSDVRDRVGSDDPDATARYLSGLGYEIVWFEVQDNPNAPSDKPEVGDPLPPPSERATLVKRVASPPPGTIVISVMNKYGGGRLPEPPATLHLEVAAPGAVAGHS